MSVNTSAITPHARKKKWKIEDGSKVKTKQNTKKKTHTHL